MIVRDLSGFVEVEDAALLYGGFRLEHAAERFIERHFKIRFKDLDDLRPDDGIFIDPEQLDIELQNHPERLLTDDLSDDEIVMFLLKFGIDLRCGRGLPLRCTKEIAAPIEAAARGLAGRLPDLADIDAEKFEAKLRAEAVAFSSKRRSSV